MEQDKAALQTNKKTAKRRKWVILLCVLAVLLIFCAYSLWVSSRSLSSYDFIRVFNADDTLGGLRFPTYDEDFTVTKQEDLTCLGVRLEGSDMHYALLYCDPESEKVRYVVILELATERDLPSLLPFIAVQLNHIAYPLQFYRDRALRETLAPFCAGDVDMIGYTEPSPNH
ncbi:MAG: hypothetical protein Q4E65_09460, partial [Clostridia bacterium]|nr:hypothetical protein [Clostridia bacterium]